MEVIDESVWLQIKKTAEYAQLDQRLDIALWKDMADQWHGYVLGLEGELPQTLLDITTNWQREYFPVPYLLI